MYTNWWERLWWSFLEFFCWHQWMSFADRDTEFWCIHCGKWDYTYKGEYYKFNQRRKMRKILREEACGVYYNIVNVGINNWIKGVY